MSIKYFDNLSVMSEFGTTYVEVDDKVFEALINRCDKEGCLDICIDRAFDKETGKVSVSFLNSILEDDQFVELSGSLRGIVVDSLVYMVVTNRHKVSIVPANGKTYVDTRVLDYLTCPREEEEESSVPPKKPQSLVVRVIEKNVPQPADDSSSEKNNKHRAYLYGAKDSPHDYYFVALIKDDDDDDAFMRVHSASAGYKILAHKEVDSYSDSYLDNLVDKIGLKTVHNPSTFSGAKVSFYLRTSAHTDKREAKVNIIKTFYTN